MNSVDALINDGAAHIERGDFGRAREVFQKAVERAEAEHGARSRELVGALMWLAKATSDNRHSPCVELERQVDIERRAVAIAEEIFSANDTWLAHCLYTHAITLSTSGRRDEGEQVLRRALDIVRAAGGDDRFYSGALAEMLLASGNAHEALAYARRSATVGEGAEADVLDLFRLGQCLRETGPRDEARSTLRRVLAALPEDALEARELVSSWIRELDA